TELLHAPEDRQHDGLAVEVGRKASRSNRNRLHTASRCPRRLDRSDLERDSETGHVRLPRVADDSHGEQPQSLSCSDPGPFPAETSSDEAPASTVDVCATG